MVTTWTRVYVCHDPITAQVVEGFLAAEGIAVRVRDLSVTPYPVNVGSLSERHIEVPTAAATRAQQLLTRALHDGLLDPAELPLRN